MRDPAVLPARNSEEWHIRMSGRLLAFQCETSHISGVEHQDILEERQSEKKRKFINKTQLLAQFNSTKD